MKFSNELIHETSPYLLQHAHNPVHWQSWGEKAFAKARQENKMLIISIGYAACHWCHVMEHESFEDEAIADLMNAHFVSIKVDREERPDVDMVYMSAAQLINGNGGWPLNALALPDGKPFFAATYFPPQKWTQLLNYFINEFQTNADALKAQAEQLSKGIREIDHIPFTDEAPDLSEEDLEIFYDRLIRRIDFKNGGLASAVKFPMPSVWEWMLEYYQQTGEQEVLSAALLTLDKMKDGGLYDQVGGGFARYSTDPEWHVPHFEKMLYDNAQLLSLYSHGFQVTRNPEYKRIVSEVVDFVNRELFDGRGFYASLDADSEKEEGKFYVWKHQEVKEHLQEEADIFCKYFGIIPQGNWEDGKNIPDRNLKTGDELMDGKRLSGLKKILFTERSKRIPPTLDNKILTSWNAMICVGLIHAGRACDSELYFEMASKNIRFLFSNLWDGKNQILFRNFQNETAATTGFLDDYAYLIYASIEMYQVTFDVDYLEKAKLLLQTVEENFYDDSNRMFFYNDKRFHQLINRPIEINDNVIPSSNSVMAENLYQLGLLTGNDKLVRQAATMVKNMKAEMLSNAVYQSNWARLLIRLAIPAVEVAIVGSNWKILLREMQQTFLPGCIFCGGEKENLPLLFHKKQEGKTIIYVCENKSCRQPVSSVEAALKIIVK